MSSLEPPEPVGPADHIDASTFGELLDDVAGHLNAQTGRLLDLAIWALANPDEWHGDGVWRLQQFLAWRTGISPAMANNLVLAAERAPELPQAVDSVRRGEMSLDQLMPIVRHVPAWADHDMTSLAAKLTVSQIRRLARENDWVTPPGEPPATEEPVERADQPVDEADADESEPDHNRVSYGTGPDGRWFLHADLDPDLGATVETALDEARDSIFSRLNSAGAGSNVFEPVTDTDGLVELANRSLDAVVEPTRRNRYRTNLYLEVNGSLATADDVTLPDSIARLLTCDGSIDPVFVRNGLPVSVGRTQRTIPDRTRRTVLKRDGRRCQVPGCTASRGLEIHHITHWADGGATDTWNLITLCGRHHRFHHKRKLGISGNADEPDTIIFTDHRGNKIRPSGANPARPSAPPEPIRGTFEHPVGERLDYHWVTFNHPDNQRHRPRPTG